MPEEPSQNPAGGSGQAAQGTAAGAQATTPQAPAAPQGQSGQALPGQTTDPKQAGPAGGAEDTFFDPKDLDPNLMPAYKQMQKAWTKKNQELSAVRQKAEAYEAFAKDPLANIQQIAARMGYKLARADEQPQQKAVDDNWQPQTWGEVMDRFKSSVAPSLRQEIMQEMQPALQELQRLRKTNIEKLLDDSCPDWRQYEDDMMGNLREHPSLVNDPVKLYRLSVPPEVVETTAFQRALKKLEDKAKGSQVGGSSTTTQRQQPGPGSIASFDDAVKYAKQKLAEQGIRPPGA